MSGHNKWAQIKHKKAVTDAQRSKVFSRLARGITVAARGNPDPATNQRLKTEVDRARAANMPTDNIERAIRKVADKDSAQLKELAVAFIGPGGAGVRAHAISDNSNRTINELRQLAMHAGARLVEPGAVAWMFNEQNPVTVTLPEPADRDALEKFLEALEEHDDVQEAETNAEL
jgi:YebC/PmpR family DNA-binding regulatory protein